MQHTITTTEGKEFLLLDDLPELAICFSIQSYHPHEFTKLDYYLIGSNRVRCRELPYISPLNYSVLGKLKDQPPELPTTVELLEFVREKGLEVNRILILETIK